MWPHRRQPPGSPVPGILQARTLEWVAISFSNAWKWKVKVKSLSSVRLFATPWTAAYQAPPSMRFSRQSTGVGCHCLLHSDSLYPFYKITWNYIGFTGIVQNKPSFFFKNLNLIRVTKSLLSHKVIYSVQFNSVQMLSHVRLFANPWIAACQASLSITNSQSSLRLTSIESVMPSSHLILCCPLLFLPLISPSIRVFSNESTLRMRWPKYWSFSFSIIPSKEIY